jgi:hypothetical protein
MRDAASIGALINGFIGEFLRASKQLSKHHRPVTFKFAISVVPLLKKTRKKIRPMKGESLV